MSTQNATVRGSPAHALLSQLFGGWGYNMLGYAYFDCTTSPVQVSITSASWDGTKLTIASTFNSPCTGKFDGVEVHLREASNAFEGVGSIELANVSVTQGQTYTVYYIETLSKPTTAPIQSS